MKSIKQDFNETVKCQSQCLWGTSPQCGAKPAQNWLSENLFSALKVRWWIWWKQQRALARRTGLCRERPKQWSEIPSCSISLNHHHVPTQVPWDISFHDTQQKQNIYVLNIFKYSVFIFLWAFRYSPQWATLVFQISQGRLSSFVLPNLFEAFK